MTRAWSDRELGVVMDTMDRPADEVAAELGRTVGAIWQKRTGLRKGWSRVRPEPWSAEEDEFLRSVPNFSAEQVGRRLGRSRDAVSSRRSLLGLPWPGARAADPTSVGRRPLVAKTCTQCGLLLDATWFGHDNRGCWKTECRRCRQERTHKPETQSVASKRAQRNNERLQALSLPYAIRHREVYVERDDEVLRDPDLSNIEKAITLGRTYKAVTQAVSYRGHSSKPYRGDPADVQWIISLRDGIAS